MNPANTAAWKNLAKLAAQDVSSLAELTKQPTLDILELSGCQFDFGKQRLNQEILTGLIELSEECEVFAHRDKMLNGEAINNSEDRAVLHTALRQGANVVSPDIANAVQDVQRRMATIAEAVRNGTWLGYTNKPITDVVHIGIGGSHLGPELVVRALADDGKRSSNLKIHFAANIDGHDLFAILPQLNPEKTLFIIASKSFTTLETQVNAQSARSWFLERTCSPDGIAKHFVAITTNIGEAESFGLAEENLLPMWDWVGGRYSLWSAVGLPIMIAIGVSGFEELLAGARSADRHFAETQAQTNIPLLSALLATWNYNFLGAGSLAVLTYDERLALLPDYLQQLEMESNGKSVTRDGDAVGIHTMPILWGGTGTRGQHAYHQLLHQGTRAFTADFILVASDDLDQAEHHNWLAANALAQSQAMAIGYDAPANQPYRQVPGNRPTSTILIDELGPRQLGALLAVYEHKVFCQGVVWNINSFDQWGVELGKMLAEPIYETLSGQQDHKQDLATQRLIETIQYKTP
ncbi:MAG: glucose-6-phosphate isomerase [Pseudomonadales bacterium]|nr:glucose-6-phosphate isomerase [Pseudomonadales bacterium]